MLLRVFILSLVVISKRMSSSEGITCEEPYILHQNGTYEQCCIKRICPAGTEPSICSGRGEEAGCTPCKNGTYMASPTESVVSPDDNIPRCQPLTKCDQSQDIMIVEFYGNATHNVVCKCITERYPIYREGHCYPNCVPGKYFVKDLEACHVCPNGTYKSTDGEGPCTSCSQCNFTQTECTSTLDTVCGSGPPDDPPDSTDSNNSWIAIVVVPLAVIVTLLIIACCCKKRILDWYSSMRSKSRDSESSHPSPSQSRHEKRPLISHPTLEVNNGNVTTNHDALPPQNVAGVYLDHPQVIVDSHRGGGGDGGGVDGGDGRGGVGGAGDDDGRGGGVDGRDGDGGGVDDGSGGINDVHTTVPPLQAAAGADRNNQNHTNEVGTAQHQGDDNIHPPGNISMPLDRSPAQSFHIERDPKPAPAAASIHQPPVVSGIHVAEPRGSNNQHNEENPSLNLHSGQHGASCSLCSVRKERTTVQNPPVERITQPIVQPVSSIGTSGNQDLSLDLQEDRPTITSQNGRSIGDTVDQGESIWQYESNMTDNWTFLQKYLMLGNSLFTGSLMQDKILDSSQNGELQRLLNYGSIESRLLYLLDILRSHGDRGFECFIKALVESHMEFVAKQLHPDLAQKYIKLRAQRNGGADEELKTNKAQEYTGAQVSNELSLPDDVMDYPSPVSPNATHPKELFNAAESNQNTTKPKDIDDNSNTTKLKEIDDDPNITKVKEIDNDPNFTKPKEIDDDPNITKPKVIDDG